MEFIANKDKQIVIETPDGRFARHAIKTILFRSERAMWIWWALCKTLYRKETFSQAVKRSSRSVRKESYIEGYEAHMDCKIPVPLRHAKQCRHRGGQPVENAVCNRPLRPSEGFVGGISERVGKLFGKRGIFYRIVGQEVTGLDGFYDHEFKEYGEYGIRIPENPNAVCDEIYEKTGVKAMIVDANDLSVEVLGKASVLDLTDKQLIDMIRDNPAGQSTELTPFILIRKIEGGAGSPE
jgi:hypothetical protein